MQSYQDLLNAAMKQLPEHLTTKQRFEIPKAKGFLQGNKTVVTNFKEIVDLFRRDAQHFLKYLLKELATPGNLEGGRLVLGRKVNSSLINAKILYYAQKFVLCGTCGKPDTQIIQKGDTMLLKCAACGAQSPVK